MKIEGFTKEHSTFTGTGFYFSLDKTEDGEIIGIITNRHVLESAISATIKLIKTKDDIPQDSEPISIVIEDIQEKILYHPEKDVDLCFIPLADIFDPEALNEGEKLCIFPFSEENFLTEEEEQEISSIEDVIMIGYPDGLIDEINFKPIIRKGITATDIHFDYDGQKEFLIDMCCFAGSSGSPILLHKYGFHSKDVDIMVGYRTRLLGILFAGV